MRNKCVTNHVLLRNETYYFLKRVPYDLKDYYSVKRLFSSVRAIINLAINDNLFHLTLHLI